MDIYDFTYMDCNVHHHLVQLWVPLTSTDKIEEILAQKGLLRDLGWSVEEESATPSATVTSEYADV